MPTEEEYGEEFSYLADYVHEDWLGFSVITGTVGKLLGKGHSMEERKRLTLRIVGDLLDLGAKAGDLTADEEKPFIAWETDKAATLSRIKSEMESLGRSPESGDICWITVDG
ncbi:hypothetical protein [Streptomyces sp. NPDC001401]|uniref:hypothetical protein n=1 Tax=Streptomyces sp. NPDC001401 TaxID=3364570 RepID=UPI0036AFCE51